MDRGGCALSHRTALIGALLAAAVSVSISGPALADPDEPWGPEHDNGDVFDGYWWRARRWVPGMVDNETWFRPAPAWSWGGAVFYAPGIMEATAEWYGFDLDGYVDGVAMMSPADIGREVWLRRPGHAWEGPYLVVDCAQRNDIWPIIRYRNEVVEVGFETAERWGMAERTGDGWRALQWWTPGVQVSKVHPTLVPDVPVTYREALSYTRWWLREATFTRGWEPKPIWDRERRAWLIDGEWRTYWNDPVDMWWLPEAVAALKDANAEEAR